ncbi:MAG: VCBS repeat-containing protein [Minicystis sp.]
MAPLRFTVVSPSRRFLPLSTGLPRYLVLGCTILAGLPALRVDTPLPALSRLSGEALAAGDFNGDGLDDLVVGHPSVRSPEGFAVLTTLISRGDGTFSTSPILFSEGFDARTARRVIAADFNRDGRLDLAIETLDSSFDRYAAILLGRGDGSFRVQDRSIGGDKVSDLAAADMNGDGIPNLVVSDSEGPSTRIDIYLGRGDGTVTLSRTHRDPAAPLRVITGDVNHDGKPDVLAITAGESTRLDVLLNDGAGKLTRTDSHPLAPRTHALAAADLDRDGNLDAVTADETSDTVHVFLGRGDGTFAPDTTSPTGAKPVSLAVGDANGDGKPEVVTANAGSDDISVLSGGEAGKLSILTTFPGVGDPGRVALANVDGRDGPEIVITSAQPAGVRVLFTP